MSVAAAAYPARRPPMRRLADALEPWLYAGPVLVLIFAVMLVPLVLGISYAFRDVQILNPFSGGFVGLDHFRALGQDEAFFRFVRLAHTVFNAGLGETWATNVEEKVWFRPVADWVRLLAEVGLEDTGARVLQHQDPTLNTLMAFRKPVPHPPAPRTLGGVPRATNAVARADEANAAVVAATTVTTTAAVIAATRP